jgi:hypothetical protein
MKTSASPVRKPSSLRIERRLPWPTSHLVIIGLLVYIAAFQTVIYTSQKQSSVQADYTPEPSSILSETLRNSRIIPGSKSITETSEIAEPLPRHAKAWRRQSDNEINLPYPIFVTGRKYRRRSSIRAVPNAITHTVFLLSLYQCQRQVQQVFSSSFDAVA